MPYWLKIGRASAVLFLLSAMPARGELKIGAMAPDFQLQDLAGKTVTLSEILSSGRPVLLSFFGSWCASCAQETEELKGLAKTYGAQVYLIGLDADSARLGPFIKKHAIDFPVLADPSAKQLGAKYEVLRGAFLVVPKLFLLSPSGTVEYISEGYEASHMKELEEKLKTVASGTWKKLDEAAVFFTASTNGCLEARRSSARSYGGFVKLVSFLNGQKKRYPSLILVDSGDFLPPSASDLQTEYILKMMALARFDAIGVGDQDIHLLAKGGFKTAQLPLVASNLSWCGDKCRPAGLPEKLITAGNTRIRIISYINPEVFALYPPELTSKARMTTLGTVMAGGKKADFLILLSHTDSEINRKIAEKYKEIDLIVGGHSQNLLQKPEKAGNALIVQPGGDLTHVGKIVLKFDSQKKLNSYEHELVPLVKSLPDDKQAAALAKKYEAALKAR